MERAVAHKKITQILGKKWGWTMNKDAPGAEKRQEAALLHRKVVATRKEVSDQLDARRKAVLEADPEYQALLAKYAEIRKHADELQGIAMTYKFEVGQDRGLFFSVHAQGDSWEEIIAILQKKKLAGDLL